MRKETGCDLTPHHPHGGLQPHGLPGKLAEKLLSEQNILSCLQLLLPVELHRLGCRAELAQGSRHELLVVPLNGHRAELAQGSGHELLVVPLNGHLDVCNPL